MRHFLIQINDDGTSSIVPWDVGSVVGGFKSVVPVEQALAPVQQALAPVVAMTRPTNCKQCNAYLKFHHEGESGYCGACGPGSTAWQAQHGGVPIGAQYIGPVGPQVHHGAGGGGSRMTVVNPGPGLPGLPAPGGGVPVIDNAAGRAPGVHPVASPQVIDNSAPQGAPVCAACKLEDVGISGVSVHLANCPRTPAPSQQASTA